MREKDELRSSLAASKKAHERETVLRVEAENCVNATRQELAFTKDVHNSVRMGFFFSLDFIETANRIDFSDSVSNSVPPAS